MVEFILTVATSPSLPLFCTWIPILSFLPETALTIKLLPLTLTFPCSKAAIPIASSEPSTFILISELALPITTEDPLVTPLLASTPWADLPETLTLIFLATNETFPPWAASLLVATDAIPKELPLVLLATIVKFSVFSEPMFITELSFFPWAKIAAAWPFPSVALALTLKAIFLESISIVDFWLFAAVVDV